MLPLILAEVASLRWPILLQCKAGGPVALLPEFLSGESAC